MNANLDTWGGLWPSWNLKASPNQMMSVKHIDDPSPKNTNTTIYAFLQNQS